MTTIAERRLVTMSAYARMRGCTHQAVSKAAKAGRITLINGRVDPEVADIQWARNTSAEQQQRGAPAQFELTQARAQAATQSSEAPLSAPAGAEDDAPAESPLLVREKSETERIRRRLLALELAEKEGELVKVADVERAYAAKLVAAREVLENLPDRLAAQLAALADPTKIHVLLADEVRLAISRLVGEAPEGVN